jgi:hypothetical protein
MESIQHILLVYFLKQNEKKIKNISAYLYSKYTKKKKLKIK